MQSLRAQYTGSFTISIEQSPAPSLFQDGGGGQQLLGTLANDPEGTFNLVWDLRTSVGPTSSTPRLQLFAFISKVRTSQDCRQAERFMQRCSRLPRGAERQILPADFQRERHIQTKIE